MMSFGRYLLCLQLGVVMPLVSCFRDTTEIPRFGDTINNLTVSVGREATFTCIVDDLGAYRVAWLRVDTQTILTIATHVITKNHRISVNHSDRRVWFLHIHEVRQADRGWYMCQLNTDPMKSQTAYLDVVVPPDILDHPTSGDQAAREGANVTLRCAAFGVPTPAVVWRREAGDSLPASNFSDTQNGSISGAVLHFIRVNRLNMGAYLCIATNGVPPSVSKRVTLTVQFPPMVWIQNQLIGAKDGEEVAFECHTEAFPKSINYWTVNDQIISQADKNYEISSEEKGYEVEMRLRIRRVTRYTLGTYRCISKNSLGDSDGTIKLYSLSGSVYGKIPNDEDEEAPPEVEVAAARSSAPLLDIRSAPSSGRWWQLLSVLYLCI